VTAEDRIDEKGLDRQLAQLAACGNTLKAFTILAEGPASPKEIAPFLDMSISGVSYHVTKLVGMGIVELVEKRDVGGRFQNFYRAVVRPFVGNEEWEKLDVAERRRISIWIFQLILEDAAQSFDAALFDARPNNHLSRIATVVDQQGFDEVAEIQDRALVEVREALGRSDKRIGAGEGAGINLAAAMMCFELPEGVKPMKVHEVPSAVPMLAIRKSN
jgi:DNA-binding transcriptional ArsR family regulator